MATLIKQLNLSHYVLCHSSIFLNCWLDDFPVQKILKLFKLRSLSWSNFFSFHQKWDRRRSTEGLKFYDLFYWLTLLKDVRILIQLWTLELEKISLPSLLTFKCFQKDFENTWVFLNLFVQQIAQDKKYVKNKNLFLTVWQKGQHWFSIIKIGFRFLISFSFSFFSISLFSVLFVFS